MVNPIRGLLLERGVTLPKGRSHVDEALPEILHYLRTLFVQGARAVMRYRAKQAPGLNHWLTQLLARTHQNVAIVALANKLIRMAWAVLSKNEVYRGPALIASD